MRLYVASSWRNDYQQEVVRALREIDHEVYDFRNPAPNIAGFNWSEIDPGWKSWSSTEFVAALGHPIAQAGFDADFRAMEWADACVLVLPCGRSAHLEAGWFAGARKPVLTLLADGEPELMYRLMSGVFTGLGPLLLFLEDLEHRINTEEEAPR